MMDESAVNQAGASPGGEGVQGCLEALRAAWARTPCAGECERVAAGARGEEASAEAAASRAIRAVATWLAGRRVDVPEAGGLLERAMGCFAGRPLRHWDEVLWALEISASWPERAGELLRTVVVSMRLAVKGVVPSLTALGVWGDDTHVLLPKITAGLVGLFPHRGQVGWMLYRQLAKSLPHLGAQGDELQAVRGAGEYLQWLLECALTRDIREDLHSKASPRNLVFVRAYLQYLEQGDTKGLEQLWVAQKTAEHDRLLAATPDPADTKRRLIAAARELEVLLTRLYAFDPRDVNSVTADVLLWLPAAKLGGGSEVARDVESAVEACRGGRARGAAEALTRARDSLAGQIESRPAREALGVLYLDLELEKLGYLLFGQIAHEEFATVTEGNVAEAVAVLEQMIRNTILKGQATAKLQRLSEALAHLPAQPRERTAQLLVLNHHVGDEIAQLSLSLYRQYSDLVRSILRRCGQGNVEVEVNRFVDGLVRDTTLQHLGELGLRVHLFALDRLEAMGPQAAAQVRVLVDALDRRIAADTTPDRRQGRGRSGRAWVFRFAPGPRLHAERRIEVLGGKGAGLTEMAALGLPVPPGFTVCTEACLDYMAAHALAPAIREEIQQAMVWLERLTGRALGDSERPLLVSVRSGAPASMPGMLDTILNVGMTDAVAASLADRLGPAPATELYVRFLAGYAKTVLALPQAQDFTAVPADPRAVEAVKDLVRTAGAGAFWEHPHDQILAAVEAVFRSWNNPHAILFRRTHRMPQTGATGATVQQMVLGNLDERSCTGVFFTRDPATGEGGLFGEYLPRAQGEDLVAGRRTPLPIARRDDRPGESLQERSPDLFEQLRRLGKALEDHYGDMQDIEFTVESGRLYVLQTRSGMRTAQAAARIAADLHPSPASPSAEPAGLPIPALSAPPGEFRIVARGLGASPGGVLGRIALSAPAVARLAREGHKTIFVRATTVPEDLAGMLAADAVLTQRGGATSHAANIARYLGKPCVVGCQKMSLDEQEAAVRFGDLVLHEGEELFLDGVSGEVGVPIPPAA